MNEEAKLILETDGKDVEAEVLFTCTLEETGKDYVIYIAPNPETGKKEINVSCYTEEDGLSGQIYPVETDEEFEILEEYFNEFVEENELDIGEMLK